MTQNRRNFIRATVSVVAAGLKVFPLAGQQRGSGGLHPPEPAQPIKMVPGRGRDLPHQAAVHGDRTQQFRRYLDQLCECAARLRGEISAVETRDIISVAVCKETQALERLAKQLKALAKG